MKIVVPKEITLLWIFIIVEGIKIVFRRWDFKLVGGILNVRLTLWVNPIHFPHLMCRKQVGEALNIQVRQSFPLHNPRPKERSDSFAVSSKMQIGAMGWALSCWGALFCVELDTFSLAIWRRRRFWVLGG